MFGRATITLGIGPHSSIDQTHALMPTMLIMAALRSRCGHYFLWSPCGIGQTIYIFMLCFVMAALRSRCGHYIFAL